MLKHKAEYKHSKCKTRRKKIIWFSGQLACYYSQFSNIFSRGWENPSGESYISLFSGRPWFFEFVVRQWLLAITPNNIQNSQGKIRMQNCDLHL